LLGWLSSASATSLMNSMDPDSRWLMEDVGWVGGFRWWIQGAAAAVSGKGAARLYRLLIEMAGRWVDCSTIAAAVMVDVCGLDVDVAQKHVKARWISLVKITRDFACHPWKSQFLLRLLRSDWREVYKKYSYFYNFTPSFAKYDMCRTSVSVHDPR
jgi:hypothetical protein